MEKRVQILDLDFLDYFTPTRPYPFHADFDNKYRFPRKLINANGPSSLKQFSSSMRPCEVVGFQFLKALQLKSVTITDEGVHHFLSHCPLLERLVVHGSYRLHQLRVSGTSLALKHLEICMCDELKSIEVCDTNLVSFSYYGDEISLLLQNVPLLVDVFIYEHSIKLVFMDCILPQLSGFFPQLQVLRLEILQLLVELDHYDFPELTNLKHLEISVSLHPNDSLLVLTPLIEASPCLERFVLLLETSNFGKRREKE
ncbi:uncharacterized protein LOC8258126 [Ricinus communis]|uniref:uncharacterized protein LOC8258126 n=1 Tax=Ricinus communis TaxID=3988 RepID=UPI0007721E0C|nr:uncharacterized protein LOC8258126 [Ricinus communis]|eukprot:XP_015579332.1 uncharacterized protein LOC8258126 [Ricinus communis]